MTESTVIEDPLKPLDQILHADERQSLFISTLEDNHEKLRCITLHDSVPRGVKQLFETAKNLSLYSWFVYRFHQVSELVAFSALEMALRERYMAENSSYRQSNKRPPALYELMQHAKNESWIKNEGFSDIYDLAYSNAKQKKMMEKILSHDFETHLSMDIDEPSEDEINQAVENMNRVEDVAASAHKLRNNLAHGSNTLHPNSIQTLKINAEIINQIFPE